MRYKTQTGDAVAGGKRARTRSALIAAALEVVEEKGFLAASLDEIAARAGMTKGAIYSNFATKADLMLAAARARAQPFAPVYEPGASLSVQLDLAARSIAQMLPGIQKTAQLQAQFQLYLQDEPELRERIARELTVGLRSLIGLVAKHHGSELTVAPESLVMTLQAMSLGFAHQSMATPRLVDEAALRSAFALVASGATRAVDKPPPARRRRVVADSRPPEAKRRTRTR